MPLRINLSQFVLLCFLTLLYCHSLSAYNLIVVPMQWVSQAGFIGLFVWLLTRFQIYLFPGMYILMSLFIWATVITLFSSLVGDYSAMMGDSSTTSYEAYVFLRFVNLMVFISTIGLTYWIQMRGYGEKLISSIVNIGVVVSVLALYIYIAQIYGLPELPRNRLGTGGGEAITEYSYAFKRAVGTFREPSHLAEWLVVPFLLSYLKRASWMQWSSLLMGVTILLTGSLTGIIAIGLALLASFIFVGKIGFRAYLSSFKLFIPVIGSFLLFGLLTSLKSSDQGTSLISVLWDRIEPIIYEQGVYSTNRSYIYEYAAKYFIPFWGEGLGNANISFGHDMGLNVNVSFLNLFLNFAFSLGIFGLALLLWVVFYPLYLIVQARHRPKRDGFVFVITAYISWLLMFIMHSEEFSIFYGIVYGMIIYMVKEQGTYDADQV